MLEESISNEELFEFLDNLREEGATNMFGAGVDIQGEFGVDKREARKLLKRWMEARK